jgi:hypothetical protein
MGIVKGDVTLDQDDLHPHGFRSKFHTARVVLGKMGPVLFLTKVLPWSFHRRYVFYSERIRVPEACPPLPARFRFGIAGKKDLDPLMALRKGYYKRDMLERRFDMGQICFLGWSGEDLVHARWTFSGKFYVPYLRRRIVLGPDEVLGAEAYTAPDFRKLGIYACSGRLMRIALLERGFKRLIVAIASWNTPVRRAVLKTGSAEIARFGYWNGPGIRRFFWSGGIEVHDDGTIIFKAAL